MVDPGPDLDRAMVLSGPVTNLRPGEIKALNLFAWDYFYLGQKS